MSFQVVFDWGARSRALQARRDLRFKNSGPSFWLTPAAPPVQIGILAPKDIASWDTAGVTPLPVSTDTPTQTATITIPNDLQFVRLDFDLSVTVGGQTSTVLSFKQLFLVSTAVNAVFRNVSTAVMPSQYSIADVVLDRSASGPVPKKGLSLTGRRRNIGIHPLLTGTTVGRFVINAEFVDVTLLWWKLHPDKTWGWYWHLDAKGRHEHLRVLAWTGGGNPMIWFVAIPDSSVTSSTKAQNAAPSPADIVLFRPPAGINSGSYAPTADGLTDKVHDQRTVRVLSRYLLSPVSPATYASLKSSGQVRTPELIADQVQPVSASPLKPSDPMDMMRLIDSAGNRRNEAFTDGFANAFRPVGLETAVNRSGGAHLLFLPLGFDAAEVGNTQGGYEAAEISGLKATLASAVATLWNSNAVARDAMSPPSSRELWVSGFSGGNRSLWRCLTTNALDIQRIITVDADTLTSLGIPAMEAAAAARIKAGQTAALDAFVIVTPNTTGDPKGLSDELDLKLRKLRPGTLVSVLPSFNGRADYWHLRPPPVTNKYFRYLLAKWDVRMTSPQAGSPHKTLLEASADHPAGWNFLFFHELAMFGGELNADLRTFFEMALGAPNPRPPA